MAERADEDVLKGWRIWLFSPAYESRINRRKQASVSALGYREGGVSVHGSYY